MPFAPTTPTRRHSWSPTSNVVESKSTTNLGENVANLVDRGLTLEDVMHAALSRSVLPLQARAHPRCMYTGENDPTRVLRQGFYEGK